MQVTCWGTRGSMPTPGEEFTIYGGDTTCIEVVSSQGERLIIDTGTGIRNLANALPEQIKEFTILYTHYHLDHLIGLPFFPPLFKKSKIDIYGPFADGAYSTKEALQQLIHPPYFPFSLMGGAVRASLTFQSIQPQMCYEIGAFMVSTIEVNHTSNGTLGLRIEEEESSFVLLIDHEIGTCTPKKREDVRAFAKGASLLFIDTHFTAEEYETHKGWGHSSLEDAIVFAIESEVSQCGFLHYSPQKTDDFVTQHYSNHSTATTNFIPLVQGLTFTL